MERRSISQVEGWNWDSDIPTRETDGGIVTRYYELHNVPICDLPIEDIRFLIGQNAALEVLVPIAFDFIKDDLFLEAEYYRGDLLHNLLEINDKDNYWAKHPELKEKLKNLYLRNQHLLKVIYETKDIRSDLEIAFNKFKD
ncbi:MAG: contact-dependent growth inhibition system immunity protein [Flexibacteraceae bacterium]